MFAGCALGADTQTLTDPPPGWLLGPILTELWPQTCFTFLKPGRISRDWLGAELHVWRHRSLFPRPGCSGTRRWGDAPAWCDPSLHGQQVGLQVLYPWKTAFLLHLRKPLEVIAVWESRKWGIVQGTLNL